MAKEGAKTIEKVQKPSHPIKKPEPKPVAKVTTTKPQGKPLSSKPKEASKVEESKNDDSDKSLFTESLI